MQNRIKIKFKELRGIGKKAFIPFIMAGDPSLIVTERLIFELERQGADIIELGVPFSDPLADGPTIQRASERALKNKINIDSVCTLVKNVRLRTRIPIVFLTYYNLIYQYGLQRFVKKLTESGVDGVIVPDLPPEESEELRRPARDNGLATIHLLAPTSSDARVKKIVRVTSGFIYYVSLTGTTGARKKLPRQIIYNLKKIKKVTRKPVCVGFGVSRPQQVQIIARWADGVIVGSAIIKVIERYIGKKKLVKRVGEFVKTLTDSIAIDSSSRYSH